jgi:hypothetical protein
MQREIAYNATMLLGGFMTLLLSIIKSGDIARITELQFRVFGFSSMIMGVVGLIVAACYPPGYWYSWLGFPVMLLLLWLVERGYIQ